MAWVATAIVGSAIIGGVVSSKSASKAADAQENAANSANATQLQAQREAQAFEQKQLDQSRLDTAPWRDAGVTALNKLAGMPDFTGANLQSEPGYQFGLSEGMKGLTNSAAARGGLLSGAALKASTRYAQDYAGTKYDAAFNRDATNKNRLASLAGIGQTAATGNANNAMAMGQNVGNMYMNTGNNMAQNQLGVGNARASSYIATGNALTNGLNQGISMWNQYHNNGSPSMNGGVGSSAYYANNDYLTS